MGEKRQLCCSEFQKIHVDNIYFRKVEHNFLLFKCELHMVTSFQRVQYEKGVKKNNVMVETPDKHYLNQFIEVNINSNKSC